MSKKKELDIIVLPEVAEKMAADSSLADDMKELFAAMRQAQQGVDSGQYKSFDDAMEAITGNRPEPLFTDEGDDT